MEQENPMVTSTSTTSVPFIGLAIVFVMASFFVATSKAHSSSDAVNPVGHYIATPLIDGCRPG